MNHERTKSADNSGYEELSISLEQSSPKTKTLTIRERLEKIDAQQNRSREKARKLKAKQKSLDVKKRNEFNELVVQMIKKQHPELLAELTEIIYSRRPNLCQD